MTSPHPDCKICGMLNAAAAEDIVREDTDWAVVAMQDVPGMLMAFTRRHDTGAGSMSEAAAIAMGPMIRDLSAALVGSGEFEKTSVIYLGDNALHTHFMLVGRKPGDAPVFDNTPLLARFAAKDRDQARAIAARLRDLNRPRENRS